MTDRPPVEANTAGPVARRWADALAAWRIPDEILAQAPASPWIHPVELFVTPGGEIPDNPSHRRAREAVPAGGAVLDVGCGGGRAAFALVPPAGRVVGVDQQEQMLAQFAAAAQRRGVAHAQVLGDWPAVAALTEDADVVVCHHVAYNVAALAPFAVALDAHARRRVVLELPDRHPLTHLAPLWRHFWHLERPDGPTCEDAADVLREVGLDVQVEYWSDDSPHRAEALPWDKQVAFMRTRLCLTPERDDEVADIMAQTPHLPRRMATLWWSS